MNRAELLAELVAEHFGNYTREYVPVQRRDGDDDPEVIAHRRADIDHDEQDYNAA